MVVGNELIIHLNPVVWWHLLEEIAIDGSYILITNYGSNTVTKFRASDGSIAGVYSTGIGPRANNIPNTMIIAPTIW